MSRNRNVTLKMASASAEPTNTANQEKSLVENVREHAIQFGYKPFTRKNIMFYYVPITGALSYTALSVNVMNPGLLVVRYFPKRDLTNLLLLHTLLGTGVYIYSRPHMSKAHSKQRACYSAFGALMFSFGSVLSWAVLRSVLPENVFICTTFGIGTSVALLKFGKEYMDYVDRRVASIE